MLKLNKYTNPKLLRLLATALVICALALTVGAASASAATYRYCSGCTIYSGSVYRAPSARYIVLDYVHRLSGPGGGVMIGAIAQYADNGSWGNWALSYATEVTHGYSGSRPAWGAAGNFGGGNYGFNAHVNY